MFLIVFIVLFIVDVPISSSWFLDEEFSTGGALKRISIRAAADGGFVDLELDYLLALADARSCLAALADSANDVWTASYFDGLLIQLDRAHPYGPATYPMTGDSAAIFGQLVHSLIKISGFDPRYRWSC
jgi:hypothetical protein